MRVRRPRAYYAAGLFNEAERTFNLHVKAMLDELGFETWFPQEDSGFLEDYMDRGLTLHEARFAIFEKNRRAAENADLLIFNLDGRVPDEGACIEAGLAYGKGVRCIGIQTDFRAVEPGGNNLMIDGVLNYEIAGSIDELRDVVSKLKVQIDLTTEEPSVSINDRSSAPYIAIAGPLGVGKTSLVEVLASTGQWNVLEEPIDENPYLDEVYANLPDLGYRMQTYYLGRRAAQHREAGGRTRPTLQERSLLEDAHVFFPAYRDAGAYDDNDLRTLFTLYEAIRRTVPMPDLIVSVEASFETCVTRIKKRDRVAERDIDQRWLGTVYDRYQSWLADFSEIPVVTVDSERRDYVEVPEHRADVVRTVQRALESASIMT